MAYFRLNPAFEREFKESAECRLFLRKTARAAMQESRGIASRFMPRGKGEQIVVEADPEGVRIVNNDHGWHLYEYGSVKTPVSAPLRRGARSVGLKLHEE